LNNCLFYVTDAKNNSNSSNKIKIVNKVNDSLETSNECNPTSNVNTKACLREITPTVIYSNADTEKVNILADNRGLVCVYRWINKINGKTYVGIVNTLSPAHCFARRFSGYGSLFYSDVKKNSNRTFTSVSCLPVVVYDNADIDKIKFLADNRNKSGVYRWINKTNGKAYVGSSTSLARRFINYYSVGYLLRESSRNNSMIYRALLKNGYTNFSIEILEYCDPSIVISREQHYIDILNPEYNILSLAGSRLGFKHSEETKAKFSLKFKKTFWGN